MYNLWPMQKTIRLLAARSLILLTGLMFMALGVALSVRANLGISPISCPPYVLSLVLPLTMGELTILMNVLIVAMQVVLLGRDFPPVQLLQVLVVVVFGYLIDGAMWLTEGLEASCYTVQLAFCLSGCLLLGFGVFSLVKAHMVPLAGEGLNLAISRRFGIRFASVKVGTDCALLLTGALCALTMMGQLAGIREGSLITALTTGMLVRWISRHFHGWDTFLLRVGGPRQA